MALLLLLSILCLMLRGWAWQLWGGEALQPLTPAPTPLCRLLVGAPQALALPGQQANRTGGLFACPLSLEETDCYRVDIDQGGVRPVGVESGEAHEEGTRGLGLLFPPLIPSVCLQLMCRRRARRTSGWELVFGARGPGERLS